MAVPQYHELMWPVLTVLKTLGASATVREIYDKVVELEKFTEEQQAISTKDGRMGEIEYRLHWARTHLKAIGAVENSSRGVWTLTERGRLISEPEMVAAVKQWRASFRSTKSDQTQSSTGSEVDPDEPTWQDQLIERLLEIPPAGFERLAQRLLREAGFLNVTVTGRSGDGGLDGVGTYRLSLVSFPVYFQCKRYRGSVTPGAVRDFRGAMAGRGEKGLLITTGSFTREAQSEASRDGAPPVELIDGDRLCDLLKEYRLGVDVKERVEEDVLINSTFFDAYA